MVAGLPRGEIGLFQPATRQRLGRLAPVWLPNDRKGDYSYSDFRPDRDPNA